MGRQGICEMSNTCLGLSKWGLIVFNMVFWCMGVVSLGIGIWLYITANEFATLSDGGRLLGSVFLLATGFGVVIAGFLGIVAALWESRIIATMFCILAVLALGMYLASGVWSLVVREQLTQNVNTELTQSISRYDNNAAFAEVWDTLHQRFNCCGAQSARDWEQMRPPFLRFAPRSCCVSPREGGQCTTFSRGCAGQLVVYERRQLDIIGPIGIAFGLFQVAGVVICILFCCSTCKAKDTYYTN